MEALKRYKNIFIGAAVLGLIALAYFTLFKGTGSDDTLLLVGAVVQSPEDILRNELLESLRELRVLNLDEKIFSDPIFNSLTDFTVELSPQPVGRDNPFLPLSGAAAVSTTTP